MTEKENKEFNLSKKRQDTNKGTDFIRYAYCEEEFNLSEKEIIIGDAHFYPKYNVKEFIRRLKEVVFSRNWDLHKELDKEIDRLAGDKLI